MTDPAQRPTLTVPYPLDPAGRRAAREHHGARIVARARADAAAYGLSYECRHDDHARHGCLSDGSGCLCECHDPGEPT